MLVYGRLSLPPGRFSWKFADKSCILLSRNVTLFVPTFNSSYSIPCWSRIVVTSVLSAIIAEFKILWSTSSAPLLNSISTISRSSWEQAIWRGEHLPVKELATEAAAVALSLSPWKLSALDWHRLTSAPCFRSSLTTSLYPTVTAPCSAVCPIISVAFTDTVKMASHGPALQGQKKDH